MLDLDRDSQVIILSHLAAADMLACKLVNKGWYNMIQELWRFVVTRVSVPDDFPGVHVPVSEYRLKAILESLGPKVISLKIAKLGRAHGNYSCECIAGIPARFPNLRSLHLGVPLNYASCMTLGFCQCLQCLTCDFGDVNLGTEVVYQWGTILSTLSSLKEFNLTSANVVAAGLVGASQFCKSIIKLSFVNVRILDCDSFNRFLRKCSKLSEFSFMDNYDRDGQLRIDVLPRALGSLHLRNVQSIQNTLPESIQKICPHFDGLKKLTLSGLSLKSPDLLGIYAFSDLKYLDLCQNYCNSEGIRTIALAPFKLFHLDVSMAPPLSEDALSFLARKQDQLRVFNLSCTRYYDHSGAPSFIPPNERLAGRFLLDVILLNPNLTTLGLAYLEIKYVEEYIRGIMSVMDDAGCTVNIGGTKNPTMTAGDEESSNIRPTLRSNLLIYLRGTLPYERSETFAQSVNGRIRLSWNSCNKPFRVPERWDGIPEGPRAPSVLSWNSDSSYSDSESDESLYGSLTGSSDENSSDISSDSDL